jgi:hypothetical protein
MTYSIKIYDNQGSVIGELPTATPQDIMKYISKGFVVIDINTNKELTINDVSETVGVSDGFIDIG